MSNVHLEHDEIGSDSSHIKLRTAPIETYKDIEYVIDICFSGHHAPKKLRDLIKVFGVEVEVTEFVEIYKSKRTHEYILCGTDREGEDGFSVRLTEHNYFKLIHDLKLL